MTKERVAKEKDMYLTTLDKVVFGAVYLLVEQGQKAMVWLKQVAAAMKQ